MRRHRPTGTDADTPTVTPDGAAPGRQPLTAQLSSSSAPIQARRDATGETDADVWPLLYAGVQPDLAERSGGPVQLRAAVVAGGPDAEVGGGGSGSAMPDGLRGQMEQSLGADFSGVRVREDASASRLGADAYTRGDDITFAPGQLDASSTAGKELIGHELVHVVQQRQGRVAATQARGGTAINADPALEREADELGARAARGEAVTLGTGTPGAPAAGETAQLRAGKVSRAGARVRLASGEVLLPAGTEVDVDGERVTVLSGTHQGQAGTLVDASDGLFDFEDARAARGDEVTRGSGAPARAQRERVPTGYQPSEDQLAVATKVKELRRVRDGEPDAERKAALARQIEELQASVRDQQEAMVRKLHPTLEVVDRAQGVYKISVSGREYFGTLEVLGDFAPSAAVDAAGDRIHSRPSESEDAKVEVAGGVAGTGAQGRVNPHPRDIDLSEQIRVTAPSADAAGAALARTIQQSLDHALAPTDGPPVQFGLMWVGRRPQEAIDAPGASLTWTAAQIRAGQQDVKTSAGAQTITLAQAFSAPDEGRTCFMAWRGPVDADGTYGEITKVIAYEAIASGSGKQLFATKQLGQDFQEVTSSRPVRVDNDRATIVDRLHPLIAQLAGAGDWIKAVKRAYTVARTNGDYAACNDLGPLLGGDRASEQALLEHVRLFVDEVLSPEQDYDYAEPSYQEVMAPGPAEARAADLQRRLGALDPALGELMGEVIAAGQGKLLASLAAYKVADTKLMPALRGRTQPDAEFADKARRLLRLHGYLPGDK